MSHQGPYKDLDSARDSLDNAEKGSLADSASLEQAERDIAEEDTLLNGDLQQRSPEYSKHRRQATWREIALISWALFASGFVQLRPLFASNCLC